MARELTPCELVERSINKKFRKTLWNPFVGAIKRYALIEKGDKIAVCISGGKDSMLLAKLMQILQRHSEVPFDLTFLVMDPGYNPRNRQRIIDNAALLEIPLTIFDTNIFEVADKADHSPCYLCAKMRRGHLYSQAQALGCNKIALGHHFSDVIETTVMGMFYGAQLQAMLPKLHSQNFPGMELIRPLYCVHEDAILAWKRYNNLEFLQCACRFTEAIAQEDAVMTSKRQETKQLLKELKRTNPNIEKSIFNALHSVCLDTFPGYKHHGAEHSFLEYHELKKKGMTPMQSIHTDKAPAAIGPYSQGIKTDSMIYSSGQIPIDPATGALVEGDITAQTHQVMQNLAAVLEAGGSSLQKVVKTTCYLQNMADFAAFNAVYETYFPQKPARSCVEVAALPKGALVEVEVIAE